MAHSVLLLAMTLVAAFSRVVDHPPNFTPILALALFGAAKFKDRWSSLLVPLSAMVLSDAALELAVRANLLDGWLSNGRGFYSGMWVVYLSVGITWLMGLALRKNSSFSAITGCSVAGSLQFYLVTNFAWWIGYDIYPHTWAGLMQSYVQALPFFGWTLAGTAYYSAILFGGFALLQRLVPNMQPSIGFDASRSN